MCDAIKLTDNEVVRRYSPMVKRIANSVKAKVTANVEVDDLMQEGLIGLVDSWSRYDAAQGFEFEAFASSRIRGAMLDNLRRTDDGVPRRYRTRQKAVDLALNEVRNQEGREAKDSEVAELLGDSLEGYQKFRCSMISAGTSHFQDLGAFLDDPGNPEEDLILADENYEPDNVLLAKQLVQEALEIISKMSDRVQVAMEAYFIKGESLVSIAKTFNVTPSRLSQQLTEGLIQVQTALHPQPPVAVSTMKVELSRDFDAEIRDTVRIETLDEKWLRANVKNFDMKSLYVL